MYNLYLTCPRGLEEVTRSDIARHINGDILIEQGGIKFTGDIRTVYTVNLYSRTGMYLLLRTAQAKVSNYNQIYEFFSSQRWDRIIKTSQTFAIRARVMSDNFSNTNLCTLKAKDGIVDQIKSKKGIRPSIDKKSPDISIFIFIKGDSIKVYLNTSGDPLFKRGYRSKIHKASMNEALAAGIVLLSGWNSNYAFYDPMCGSGTIPIEAALIAKNIPPGLYRKAFGFENWNDFDQDIWKSIIKNSRESIISKRPSIFGSDIIKKNIELSIKSAKLIGLGRDISFSEADIKSFNPSSDRGTVVVNPPYGQRLGEILNLKDLYGAIGDIFKSNCAGHDAFVFTANADLAKSIGLRTKKRTILYNGKLESRLLYYPIMKGSYG